MRTILVGAAVAAALLFLPSSVAATSGGRPVALVVAEASDEVFAVSLGPHGGRVLERVRLDDPLMVAAPLRGPAVVVNPHGTVTLLAWHSLRPIKVLRGFDRPEVAAIAPGDRYAYVSDAGSGRLVVIDLSRRRIVHRVFVGPKAHHLDVSPDGETILQSAANGRARLLSCAVCGSVESVVTLAKARAFRDLTPDEERRFSLSD